MSEIIKKKEKEFQKLVDSSESLLLLMDMQEIPTEEGTEEETIDATTVVVMSILSDLNLLMKCYKLVQSNSKFKTPKSQMN